MKLSELVFCNKSGPTSSALDRASVGPLNLRIYRITVAGTKWGADAMARSNYAALKAEFKDWLWCVIDPEDGPLYVPGHLSADGQGHYDDTPPWDDCFNRAALVFHDGEAYVNADYEFESSPEAICLHNLANMIDSLDGYPVLDEEALSALEYEEAIESLEETAKWDLPRKIGAQNTYGYEALELDPDFKITVDDIVAACRELDIDWENETSSDGSNYAYIRDEDMKRITEHLTPPWFKAACDGLEWADLGYPQPHDPEYPPIEVYEPVLPLPSVAPDKLRTFWIGG